MAYVRKLPEKYQADDMPVAATFVCPDKYAKMKVKLLPAIEKADLSGRIVRQRDQKGADTSVKIEFTNSQIEIRNYALLNLMVKSPAFNRRPIGFTIDKTDPTGFWRSIDLIEEKSVAVSKMVYDGSAELELPKKADLNRKTKAYRDAQKDDDGQAIEVVPLLVRD